MHQHFKNTNKPPVGCTAHYERAIVILPPNGKMEVWETPAPAVVLAVVGLSLA